MTEQNHVSGTRRLCIVSSNPILSAELVAAIQTALQPHDEIEIIRDRRRDPASRPPGSDANRPPVERRRQPHVDRLVKTEGFAIVPVRVVPPIEQSDAEPSPTRPPVERPLVDGSDADRREIQRILEFKRRHETRSERQEPRAERQERRAERPEPRGDRFAVAQLEDDGREVEHILDLQRRQEVRIGSWLVLTVVLAATLIVVVQLPPVKAFLDRTRPPTAPPQSEQASQPPPAPSPEASSPPTATPPAATPSPATPPAATAPAPTPPTAAQEPPPAVESPSTAQSSPRAEAPPAPRPGLPPVSRPDPRGAQARPAERPAAQARPAERPSPREAALPRATSSPTSPSASFSELRSRGAARPSITSAQFPGLPRVEVVRDSTSAAEGRGAAYAVRISDTAGRPLSGAEVMLLARMSDGSVENITLGSGAEPGSYHGALPAQSTPVDLRVRVITSDKRVEIPLKP